MNTALVPDTDKEAETELDDGVMHRVCLIYNANETLCGLSLNGMTATYTPSANTCETCASLVREKFVCLAQKTLCHCKELNDIGQSVLSDYNL